MQDLSQRLVRNNYTWIWCYPRLVKITHAFSMSLDCFGYYVVQCVEKSSVANIKCYSVILNIIQKPLKAIWQNQPNGLCSQGRLRSAWACAVWSEPSLGTLSCMPYFSDSYCEIRANLPWDFEIYPGIWKPTREIIPGVFFFFFFNTFTVNMHTVQTRAQLNNFAIIKTAIDYWNSINNLQKLINHWAKWLLFTNCLFDSSDLEQAINEQKNYQKLIFFKYYEIGIPWHKTGRCSEMDWDFSPRQEISHVSLWVAKHPMLLHADSKGSDQTGRMPRLSEWVTWVFALAKVILLGFVMRQLIYF